MSRETGSPALHDHDLMARVLHPVNLMQAWKRVHRTRGAPGVDGIRIEDWPAHAREHWAETRRQLEAGSYRPQPVRRVMIPKKSGGERPLGIPTVTDRVIQQAIAQVLTPIFDHVQHDILMARVARKVRDKRLLALIGRYLRAGRCRRCWPTSCSTTWIGNWKAGATASSLSWQLRRTT